MSAHFSSQRTKLRDLMAKPGVIPAGGIADALQGLVAQSAGYPAVYISGLLVNYTHGYPDGTLTMMEVGARLREVATRLNVPVIVDADEGFGGIPQLIRTVREFERAGASAMHLEDLVVKKKGAPLPLKEAVSRIRAALDARADRSMVIIARTDAMAPWRHGLADDWAGCDEEAFDRMCAYAEAGADVVLPLYPTVGWLARYGSKVPKPLLALYGLNAPRTPRPAEKDFDTRPASALHVSELEQYNVKIMLNSVNIMERIFPLMKSTYAGWLQDGIVKGVQADLDAKAALNGLVGTKEMDALYSSYES
jgi:2-methylisocitrate lyase-like PEP mutase family enzyme